MNVINMHQAKTQLSKLVKRAMAGEEIVIGKAGEPMVRLVVYSMPGRKRKPGGWEGKVWIAPDFDNEDPEINKMFYGDDDASAS